MFGMAATIAATTALFCFLSLVAVLVFLWKVYKRGGRADLAAASRAIRDSRPRRTLHRWQQHGGQLSPEASKGGSLSAERKS